jgi:hypothetical protein
MRLDRETHADWFYVVGIIGGTIALLLCTIAFIVWVVYRLWAMIANG